MMMLGNQSTNSGGCSGRTTRGRDCRPTGHSCILVTLWLLSSGCFGPPEHPETLEVVLPNDVRRTAVAGSGAGIVENSTWAAFRKAEPVSEAVDAGLPGPYGGLLNGGFLQRPDPDTLMYRIEFVEGGRATRVSENAFYLPALFGREFLVDGSLHPGRLVLLSYSALSFGVSDENRFGLAIPVEVRFLGIPLGRAAVYAWGTVADARLDGVFGYMADLNPLPELLLGSGGDQYPFYALRDASASDSVR
jgi:hypothetical protein